MKIRVPNCVDLIVLVALKDFIKNLVISLCFREAIVNILKLVHIFKLKVVNLAILENKRA